MTSKSIFFVKFDSGNFSNPLMSSLWTNSGVSVLHHLYNGKNLLKTFPYIKQSECFVFKEFRKIPSKTLNGADLEVRCCMKLYQSAVYFPLQFSKNCIQQLFLRSVSSKNSFCSVVLGFFSYIGRTFFIFVSQKPALGILGILFQYEFQEFSFMLIITSIIQVQPSKNTVKELFIKVRYFLSLWLGTVKFIKGKRRQ